jgi:hypothetical protein
VSRKTKVVRGVIHGIVLPDPRRSEFNASAIGGYGVYVVPQDGQFIVCVID